MHLVTRTCAITIILSTFILPTLVKAQMREVEPPHFEHFSPKTFQTLIKESGQAGPRSERRIQNSNFYLPGLGVLQEFIPGQVRPQRQSPVSPVSPVKPLSVSPVSVTVSDRSPPSGRAPGEEKCQYVQMKGEKNTLDSNCMRGGMSCERQCDYDTSQPVCEETLTDVCEDKPEEVCQTVLEQTCRTVQEEECSDPEQSNTKTECNVVMEEQCQQVRQISVKDNQNNILFRGRIILETFFSTGGGAGLQDGDRDGVRDCGEGGLHHHEGASLLSHIGDSKSTLTSHRWELS